MDLIILPGNSKQFNEKWLYDSAKTFTDMFDVVTTHIFKHWQNENEKINLDFESERLIAETKNKDDYIIYAKSVGVITAIKTIVEKGITPKACIFVGCPFGEFASEIPEFKEWFKKYDIYTLFIQQTNDPFFSYLELETFIDENGVKNYELIEIPGDNHAYDNYKEIRQLVVEFLG
ncbi:hypothetical protein HYV31_00675 [candidate division WWE3 bacterium]|nr:hypothetical protein [candidate division WWE3 bacterium]